VVMMCLHAAIAFLFCNALFAFNLTAIVALCAFLRAEDFGARASAKPKPKQADF
jgi:hypothetical protein